MFDEPNFIPHKPRRVIQEKTASTLQAMQSPAGNSLTIRTEQFIRWVPPPPRWYKLNVDGEAKGNPGMARGGGVLRGHRGEWISGFAAHFGYCSSVKAELKALLQGLGLARDYGVRRIMIHMDSLVVSRKVQDPVSTHQPYYYLWKEGQALLLNPEWQVTLDHCYREANTVADQLANLGVEQLSPLAIFERPPNAVLSHLAHDCNGPSWPHMIQN